MERLPGSSGAGCKRQHFVVIYSSCLNNVRACGAAGSAPAWHAGGQGFKSPQVHKETPLRRVFFFNWDAD